MPLLSLGLGLWLVLPQALISGRAAINDGKEHSSSIRLREDGVDAGAIRGDFLRISLGSLITSS